MLVLAWPLNIFNFKGAVLCEHAFESHTMSKWIHFGVLIILCFSARQKKNFWIVVAFRHLWIFLERGFMYRICLSFIDSTNWNILGFVNDNDGSFIRLMRGFRVLIFFFFHFVSQIIRKYFLNLFSNKNFYSLFSCYRRTFS